MKDKNDIVYSINIEDIQTVAIEEINIELTEDEIVRVSDLIGDKINWYDVIFYSILKELT